MKSSEFYNSIYNLYKKHGGFPPVWLISKESGLPQETVEKYLSYFCSIKKIIRKNNLYWFPEQLENKNNLERKSNFSVSNVCRIIMGIVGVSCIVCSIRFTYSFNKLNMPEFWGFILSSAIAIFTSFCFTVRDFLKKSNKKFQANIFIILYFMGVSYSIFTAIAGQYNDYIISNQTIFENSFNDEINNRKYELLKEQKDRYINQINSYNTQLEAQQKIILDLSSSPERKFEYNNTWKQANALSQKLQEDIQILEDKISEIDSQLINSISVDSNKNKNIFDWIADLFHISSDIIQFIISLFPAIFIDLVSPFAISFAFNKNI